MNGKVSIEELMNNNEDFVVVTRSAEEAERLDNLIHTISGHHFGCESIFIARNKSHHYNGEVAFQISGKQIRGHCYRAYYEDNYLIPIYDFSDLVYTTIRPFELGDIVYNSRYGTGQITKVTQYNGENTVYEVRFYDDIVDMYAWGLCMVTKKSRITTDKNGVPLHTNENDIDKAIRLSKEVREQLEKNNKKLKEKKEMKNTFFTVQGERIDTTCNKKVKTITTYATTTYAIANFIDGGSAYTTCDESEYDAYTGALVAAAKITAKKSEETYLMYDIAMKMWGTETCNAILETFANRAFAGNFKKYYSKWLKDEKRYNDNKCKCSFCGNKFNTPDEAREHEIWHVEHKRQKYENYLIRREAKRRLALEERESKIEAMMDKLDNDGE